MKVFVYCDSTMVWVAQPTNKDYACTIEVPDAEWDEFQRVEKRYNEMLDKFVDALTKKRAA